MTKVLLYSGGMDSWLIDKLWKPDVKLFFDIGTPNCQQELERVKKRNDVEIIKFPLAQFEQPQNNYYLPLRNLHFVAYAAHYGDTICLGATGSSTHKDKNDVFGNLCENAINYLLSEDSTRTEPVKIVMPYRGKSKTEILAEYLMQGGDIEECYNATFSCYNPTHDGKPCMNCTSCLSKFTAFYNNGYRFDDDVTQAFINNTLTNGVDKGFAKGESLQLAINLKYKNKSLFIDFDNTVTEPSVFPNTGNLRPGCREKLEKLKDEGYYLTLYTTRTGIDFYQAINFCKVHNLPFDNYLTKPAAYRYIDDRNITFKLDDSWNNFNI